jgi:hypothetical protein
MTAWLFVQSAEQDGSYQRNEEKSGGCAETVPETDALVQLSYRRM